MELPPQAALWYVRGLEAVTNRHQAHLTMQLKVDEVFEHYAAKSEYYRRANIAQRFQMEEAFYRLTMELLAKIQRPISPAPTPAANPRRDGHLPNCATNRAQN